MNLNRLLFSAAFLLLRTGASAHPELLQQIDDVTSEIAEFPTSGVLYLRRAQLCALHEDFPSALADLVQAEHNGADPSGVQLARANTYLSANRLDDAEAQLQLLLARAPRISAAHLSFSKLHEKRDHYCASADSLTSAIQLAASPLPEWYVHRADLLTSAGARVTEVVESLDDGITRLGALITLRLKAVEVLRAARDYRSAALRMSDIAAAAPRKEAYLVQLVELYQLAGDKASAAAVMKQAHSAITKLPSRLQNTSATKAIVAQLQVLENR